MHWWIILLIAIILYWILDAIWATVIARFFHSQLEKVLKKKVDRLGGLIVWILMAWGLLIFVVNSPAVSDMGDAFSMGMIFGMVVYGVSEATNVALLKKRTWTVFLVDTARGMLLCGIMSVVLWYLIQTFGLSM